MGYRKYPILDEDAEIRLIGACRTPEERGLVKILLISGMHISSCVSLTRDNIKKRGSRHFLEWSRTKTRRGVPAQIPKDYLDDIVAYLSRPRRLTRQQHNNILRDIGERAGYDELAPMTFRHTLCVKLIRAGWAVPEIAQKLGCSHGVVVQNYAILREDQLLEMEGVE